MTGLDSFDQTLGMDMGLRSTTKMAPPLVPM